MASVGELAASARISGVAGMPVWASPASIRSAQAPERWLPDSA